MGTEQLTVAVVGAGGKMGMRVSANLARSQHNALYSETSPAGQERVRGEGRQITDTEDAVRQSDVVILAVPDLVLGDVSKSVVPQMMSGATLLTLDPAAAYAGLLAKRDDVFFACAHPCHPSVFLERTSKEEWADTFGGIAAPQDAVAALEGGGEDVRGKAESVIRIIYAPVINVHWVTVKQLAVLEPTLVETIACMLGAFLNDALQEAVKGGIPEPAAKAMLFGHTQIALANALRGDNPFSAACLIAMDYGRESIIKEDWKKVFDDRELDKIIGRMLQTESDTLIHSS
jgi:hypothetical protein